jgi:DNA polymerase-3 subunit delta'
MTVSENWGIIGHAWAVDFLRSSIQSGRAAHAYLISGPAGVGKALLALRLAQALNCETEGPDPCLQCRSCKRIANGNHPDIRIAGMASQAAGLKAEDAARQKDLKIDTIRTWQGDITLRPFEAKQRVLILHDAERLTEGAANAMLKTLEEPPPYAKIILVANTSGDLMATIVSRCQLLKLRPVGRPELQQALIERYNLPSEDARLLTAWSGGRPGWAIHMIQEPDELAARQEQLDNLLALHSQDRSEGFRWAEERAKDYRGGEQSTVVAMLELWQSWWRDVLLVAAGCNEAVVHVDRFTELQKLARTFSLADIHAFIARIDGAVRQLRENVNPQLALENVFLHLPSTA